MYSKSKFVILVVIFSLMLSIASYAVNFKDMNETHWAYSAVTSLADRGVIAGFPDGTYKPNEKVTREQFAKVLVSALNLKRRENKIKKELYEEQAISNLEDSEIEDVEENRWSKEYIDIAREYIPKQYFDYDYYDLMGYHFKPTLPITREIVAVSIVKSQKLENEIADYELLDSFTDKEEMSDKYRRYIAIAIEYGLMQGKGKNFDPKGTLTRAEMATLINNVENKKVKEVSKIEKDLYGFWEIESAKNSNNGENIYLSEVLGTGIQYGGGIQFNEDGTTYEAIGITSLKSYLLSNYKVKENRIVSYYDENNRGEYEYIVIDGTPYIRKFVENEDYDSYYLYFKKANNNQEKELFDIKTVKQTYNEFNRWEGIICCESDYLMIYLGLVKKYEEIEQRTVGIIENAKDDVWEVTDIPYSEFENALLKYVNKDVMKWFTNENSYCYSNINGYLAYKSYGSSGKPTMILDIKRVTNNIYMVTEICYGTDEALEDLCEETYSSISVSKTMFRVENNNGRCVISEIDSMWENY